MRTFLQVGAGLLIGMAAAVLAQASEEAPQPQFVIFEGVTSVLDNSGRPLPVRLKVANWVVTSHNRIENFPKQGFLIVELFAGEPTTFIDGKRQQRVDGETFTVPSQSKLGIETENDAATFQTIEIETGSR